MAVLLYMFTTTLGDKRGSRHHTFHNAGDTLILCNIFQEELAKGCPFYTFHERGRHFVELFVLLSVKSYSYSMVVLL